MANAIKFFSLMIVYFLFSAGFAAAENICLTCMIANISACPASCTAPPPKPTLPLSQYSNATYIPEKQIEIAEQVQEKPASPASGGLNKTSIIVGLIISLAIFIIVVMIIFMKKRKAIKKELISSKLTVYIKNNLMRGYDINAIRKKLIEAGYDNKIVDELIEQALKQRKF